jgi:hypothetical protein
VSDGTNPADEVRKAKSRRDWTVRQLVADYRDKVLSTLAESIQASYGRNLKRIENGMGGVSAALVDIDRAAQRLRWFDLIAITAQQVRKLVRAQCPHRLLDLLVIAPVVWIKPARACLAAVLLDEAAELPDETRTLSICRHDRDQGSILPP